MPLSPKRRNLAIVGGFVAVLLIALVVWQARQPDPVSAELIEISTDTAGVSTAVFMFTNRTSRTFDGAAVLWETSSKRSVRNGVDGWIGQRIAPYEGIRFEMTVPSGTGEWFLELALRKPEPGEAALRAAYWLHRTVDTITPDTADRLKLKKRINATLGIAYFPRSDTFRANQAIRREGTATNAP